MDLLIVCRAPKLKGKFMVPMCIKKENSHQSYGTSLSVRQAVLMARTKNRSCVFVCNCGSLQYIVLECFFQESSSGQCLQHNTIKNV